MNEAPKGKIGRLPKAVQEQVNRRLENGKRARTLVAWLNALPEAQAVLAAEFAGKPIHEQNLSDWRKHGYQQWLNGGKPAGNSPTTSGCTGRTVRIKHSLAARPIVFTVP